MSRKKLQPLWCLVNLIALRQCLRCAYEERTYRVKYRLLGVSTCFMVLVGCAGSGVGLKTAPTQIEAQEVVASRAKLRWEALISGDLAVAYTYLSPGVRNAVPLSTYRLKIRPGLWRKASLDSISCQQDMCKVTMLIEYAYRDMKSIKARLDEDWLWENGQWWYTTNK